MDLRRLLIRPGETPIPSARAQNEILKHLLRNRLLGSVEQILPPSPFVPPWNVTVSRFDPLNPTLATLDPASTFSVFIGPGTINDVVPSILYAAQNDPRGWRLPSDYVAPAPGSPTYDPRWIERDGLDDPSDPPFLALSDPKLGATAAADWTYIPDNQRLSVEQGAFCGASDWELELWRSYVIASATPLTATFFDATLPPPPLNRYRLASQPALPADSFGGSAGGWQQLATLYLLRDPNDPTTAEVRVRQRQWWPMWAVIVQPGGDLVAIDAAASSIPGAGGLAGLAIGQLQDTLQGASSVQWWTV